MCNEVKAMKDGQKVPRDGLGKKLRAQFVAGILVVVPLGASVLILIWIFNGIDH
jgi:hypothetical protein